MPPDMRGIDSGRVVLEPQAVAHAEEMFRVQSDPAIYAYENAPPQSLEWLRERLRKLESRQSADGREQWLNWVVRLPTSELAGYVQATVDGDGNAAIAYELASAYWGRGLGYAAVSAMIGELAGHYEARHLTAVFKRDNVRSRKLLERLGFIPATPAQLARTPTPPDESLMCREVR
jgi:ribosomal-protein-alanine N-acetyltransferase